MINKIKHSINCLESLKNEKIFWTDCILLEKMAGKISLRLRNSIYSCSLNQLCRLIEKFRTLNRNIVFNISNEINLKLIEQLEQYALFLFKIQMLSQKCFR